MKKVKAVCPECKQPWEKKLPTNSLEMDREDIAFDSTADACPVCQLMLIFEKNPARVVPIISAMQTEEGNIPCFCTGIRENCGRDDCRWRRKCDKEAVEKAV